MFYVMVILLSIMGNSSDIKILQRAVVELEVPTPFEQLTCHFDSCFTSRLLVKNVGSGEIE
jgi:hypothetical protein